MATNSEVVAFIQRFGTLAVAECNRRIANGEGFILPSVCMAQSALETNWGTAGIMVKANAFFGVKAGGSWTGAVYRADTWEVAPNGEAYNTVANFRAYDDPVDSLVDYYNLTVGASRYSKAVSYGADSSKWLSARETITAIWQGGYATDDEYVPKIMNTINGRNLTEWDTRITGVYNGEINENVINKFVQGHYKIIDSGRALEVDSSNTKAVSVAWDNAVDISSDKIFKVIGLPSNVKSITLWSKVEDTGSINGYEITIDSTIRGVTSQKVAFTFTSDVDISPTDFKNTQLIITSLSLPSGQEISKSPIAKFIKVL